MGAGVAKAFANMYPALPRALAENLRIYGNVTNFLPTPQNQKAQILSLPTKNHWKDPSDIQLIIKSLKRLVEITNEKKYKYVMLVRPGCSNGQLSWYRDVKPICDELLDDRFYVISF